jgi:tRNA pseudouridine38-40 synthase
MRIALGVEYDGRCFKGWQAQRPGVRTVQTELETALSRVANHPVRIVCAGRTDTGVHGIGQVAHFDTDADRDPHNWLLGTNVNLPTDVNVTWAKPVGKEFHARFSAVGRYYRYLVLSRASRSSLLAGRATWVHRPLDRLRMHRAGQTLLGRHDFSSYRALGCQAKSPIRTVRRLAVRQSGDLLELQVEADGFLHHMIRNIAGVLIAIGSGDRPMDWAAEVLALRDRTLGGVTAPPDGLYLARVDYPESFRLPLPNEYTFLF